MNILIINGSGSAPLWIVLLHLTYLARLSAGFLPTGEELVHQCMETGIMAWLQQMAQFMNHHVLDTCTSPFFTMRIDSLLVLLYVTCIAISIKRKKALTHQQIAL